MFRPRFSLRLLLMVTALIATILGWRAAVRSYGHELRRRSHNQERYELDYALYVLQSVKKSTHSACYNKAIEAFQDRIEAIDSLDY
jgi:hypothetical protein